MTKHSRKRGGCYGGRRRTARKFKGGAYGVGQPIAVGAIEYNKVDITGPVKGYPSATDNPSPVNEGGGYAAYGGRRRRTKRVVKKKSAAAIRRLLKAKGLKVSGSKRALTLRARKARIPMKGGRSSLTGAPYHSYTGHGDAGLTSKFAGAHRVWNDVVPMPGWGPGSSKFIQSESGGLVDA
jgi:hypothetical protein